MVVSPIDADSTVVGPRTDALSHALARALQARRLALSQVRSAEEGWLEVVVERLGDSSIKIVVPLRREAFATAEIAADDIAELARPALTSGGGTT